MSKKGLVITILIILVSGFSNISTATYTRYVKVNSSLNVRSGAGINYSYIRSLYNGNKV